MRRITVAFGVVAILLVFITVGHAQTNVSGTVNTTTWTAANSPYRVIGAITVPTGEALTIEAGVNVLFDADVEFIVQGKIHVMGTEEANVRFAKGSAPEWGGIRISGGQSSSFVYTRISGGRATNGGGVYLTGTGTNVTMANCLIFDNVAGTGGGGIANEGATLELSNCTVTGNTASSGGGGLYKTGATPTTINNCIFWNNTAGSIGNEVFVSNSSITAWYSVFLGSLPESVVDGGGNLFVDPLFVDAANGDYSLQEGSPCIDTGDPALFDPDSTRSDIGAFYFPQEMPGAHLAISDVEAQSAGTISFQVTATAEQVRAVSLALLIDPTLFDGEFTVSAPVWTVQNPVDPENPEESVFVEHNVDGDTLFIEIASSDPIDFVETTLCEVSGQLVGQLSAQTTSVEWITNGVEVNGDAFVSLMPGSITIINNPPVWDESMPTVTISVVAGDDIDPIDLIASDPESESLEFSIVTNPVWISLDGSTLYGTPGAGDTGLASVTVSANDGVNSTPFTIEFDVIANDPPVWDVSMPTAVVGVEDQPIGQIDVLAIDPEGKVVTYNLVSAPAWVEFDGTAITGTPGHVDIGTASVNVSASDGMNTIEHTITITVQPYYGDPTKDGSISALDASMVLQHKVKKIAEIDIHAANVTREMGADPVPPSAWDAAHILYKVVMPSYVFPVQGGETLSKPAQTAEAALAWVQTASDWVLKASGGTGPLGADIVLQLPESATFSSDAAFAYARDGELVTIGVATTDNDVDLLRVSGVLEAPEVVSATLNGAPATIAVPLSFKLRQNAPNPFNPSTTISFSIPESAPVMLSIYDANGRLVRTLANGTREAGWHEITWDGLDNTGRAVASGMYLYRLVAGENIATQRLTLVR